VSGQLKSIVKRRILGVVYKSELCKNEWTSLNDMFPWKDVPFGVSLIMLPIRGSSPPKPAMLGMNRHFQAKCAKY